MRTPGTRVRTSLVALAAALAAGMTTFALPARAGNETPPPPPPPETEPAGPRTGTPGTQPTPPGGRYLLLPDISFIGNFVGHYTNDKRDEDRNKLKVQEGEIGIQSMVYPGIRADAFIVFHESETLLEEGYLTVQQLAPRVSAVVGRRREGDPCRRRGNGRRGVAVRGVRDQHERAEEDGRDRRDDAEPPICAQQR